MHSVLWLIAARSGSKGIPHKNIKILGTLPLLAYRIKSVRAFARQEDVWISTDSQEYAEIARSFGATIPFIRPEKLAADNAKSIDVVLHTIEFAENHGKKYTAIGLLEPTAPFITAEHLYQAVEQLFADEEAENIVAVRKVRPSTFYVQEEARYLKILADKIRQQGVFRRQDEKTEITPSGGFYIAKWDSIKMNKSFYTAKTLSYLVPNIHGLEIDETIDWLWAEFLIKENIINQSDMFEMKMKLGGN